MKGEARSGTGKEGARLSRLGRLEVWMVIGELAVPTERDGSCRRMSLPEDVPPGGASALPSGPKLQATQSALGDAEAALPQKWDGGGAPSLP